MFVGYFFSLKNFCPCRDDLNSGPPRYQADMLAIELSWFKLEMKLGWKLELLKIMSQTDQTDLCDGNFELLSMLIRDNIRTVPRLEW